MELLPHLVPPEEHNRHESRLKEESQDAFNSQRGTEDIANKPGIIGPVGSEFKFQDYAGGHSYGEVDSKEGHPELRDLLPDLITCTHINSLHERQNE